MTTAAARTHAHLISRLAAEARPFWRHLLAITALELAGIPLALLAPLPLKIAVDNGINGQPLSGPFAWLAFAGKSSVDVAIIVAALLVVAIAVAMQVQKFGAWLLEAWTGERLVLAFRARLFAHVQRLSIGFHDTRGTSDSIFRIQYDAPSIQWLVVYGFAPFLTAGLTVLGMIVVTARIDWQIAVIALAVTPVLFALIRHFARRLRTRWHAVKEFQSSAASVVQEALTALRVVKAFGQEGREGGRFVRQARQEVDANLGVVRLRSMFFALVAITLALGTAAALFIGVGHVRQGAITLGELLMVMTYLAQLYGPLESISNKLSEMQGSIASVERAFALLEHHPDVPEAHDARPLARARGDIRFDQVRFGYVPTAEVLHGLSFHVPAGTRVGIMGRTGAGKSTLASLLPRFYDPTAGSIFLDGIDIRRYRLRDLRRQFAIVLQDTVLFSTTIAENIGYGDPAASRDAIVAAGQAAGAHEFIAGLPHGYDTAVGERGMTLSGGQRQRIALARAFLLDAPVLILDEPTSAVDTQTERAIIEGMERLMAGRTTFMIAHRLSTLERCDMLLVLQDGRVKLVTVDVRKALRDADPALFDVIAPLESS